MLMSAPTSTGVIASAYINEDSDLVVEAIVLTPSKAINFRVAIKNSHDGRVFVLSNNTSREAAIFQYNTVKSVMGVPSYMG